MRAWALVGAVAAVVSALAAVLWVVVQHAVVPGEPLKPQYLGTPPSPAGNVVPLPPPFGNATSGCAGWYVMMYLRVHGWRPGMPPPMLPMICWASMPQPVVQEIVSAVNECVGMGYEPLYYGNGYVVCINGSGYVVLRTTSPTPNP